MGDLGETILQSGASSRSFNQRVTVLGLDLDSNSWFSVLFTGIFWVYVCLIELKLTFKVMAKAESGIDEGVRECLLCSDCLRIETCLADPAGHNPNKAQASGGPRRRQTKKKARVPEQQRLVSETPSRLALGGCEDGTCCCENLTTPTEFSP